MTSYMPNEGVIFSDGLFEDAINFHSGVSVDVSTADEKGLLVV